MNTIFSSSEFRVAVYVSTIVFVMSIMTGQLINSSLVSTELLNNLKTTLSPLKDVSPILVFLIIFINNAVKSLLVIFMGVLAGIPGLIFIWLNGFIIGIVVSLTAETKGWQLTMASTLPHGIIEIPLLIVTVALSLLIGRESLRWLLHKNSNVKSRLILSLKTYLKVILPGLFIAALIETFVTPLVVNMVQG